MKKHFYFLSIITVATTMLFSNCGGKKEEEKKDSLAVKQELVIDKIISIGRIEPESKLTNLYSEVNGIVEAVNIKPGDSIRKGQIVLQLSSRTEASQLRQAKSKLSTQASQIESNKASLEVLKTRLINTKTILDRTENLFNSGAETKQNYDNAKTEYEAALENIKQAEATVHFAQNRYNELMADINFYQVQLDKRAVRAPADGQILTVDIRVGELISSNTIFSQFAPAGNKIAVCEVDELSADKVMKGQKAYIRTQGMSDTLATGMVTFTSPALKKKSIFSDQVSDLEDRRVREVWIRIDKEAKSLLLGSRIEGVILMNPTNNQTK